MTKIRAVPQAASFLVALAIGGGACSSESPVAQGTAGAPSTSGAGGMAEGGMTGVGGAAAGSGGRPLGGAAGTPATGGVAGHAGTAGSAGSGGAPFVPAVCGDGKRALGEEACDDGGKAAGDGCSATCAAEPGYACPAAGGACTPKCGDAMLVADEACDDRNASANDGCSDKCKLEDGWECKTLGMPCTGICGDGIVADEACDDKNKVASDGCSATCTTEPGFICDVPGSACRKPLTCAAGVCTSACGDGNVLGIEACDDGNTANGDGCSSTCKAEAGWTCVVTAAALPAEIAIPVTYRDFINQAAGGSTKHPDHQTFAGGSISKGLIAATLGPDGLPVYTGICQIGGANVNDATLCPNKAQTTSKAAFDQWFRPAEGVNITVPGSVVLKRDGQGPKYTFDGGTHFTPVTGKGWDVLGKEGLSNERNYGFTSELRYWFQFKGGEVLEFSGDDDVWVFIGGKLAVDIGGSHAPTKQAVALDPATATELGLTAGTVYEIVVFHAERGPGDANLGLTLSGFVKNNSTCTAN